MNSRVLALVIALIMVSGCLSIDVFHKVNRDGSSLIIQEIDLREVPSDIYSSASPSQICENIMERDPGAECSFEDMILTINKTLTAEEGNYIFDRTLEFPYSLYSIEVRRTPTVISQDTEIDVGQDLGEVSDFKEPSSAPTAEMLRAAGVRMTYIIDMPGEITSVENGDIIVREGRGYAQYDVLQLMSDGEYMIVKSKELDLVAIGMAVAAIGLLFGAIGVAIVLREAMEKKMKGGFGR